MKPEVETLKTNLVQAATDYDRKQAGKKGYNRFALGQYFQRIDAVCEAIDKGADVASELGRGFNGRLLTIMAKAANVERKEDSTSWGY